MLYHQYLSPEALDGFKTYKYNCKDTNPLSIYVLHPFWDRCVLLCPRWIAPNLLTLVGFLCCVASYALPAYYDPKYHSDASIPACIWISAGVLLFLSHTLDGIDGKQARRTGTSSPLGELFDHGCDSWAACFIVGTFFSLFGREDGQGFSIGVVRMYGIVWVALACFYASHWEKYNTGVLFLPWAYDFAMVSGSVLFVMAGIFGVGLFRFTIAGGHASFANMLEVVMYVGSIVLVPVSLVNVVNSYRDGTGKMRPLPEAVRPLFPIAFLGLIGWGWAMASPNDVMSLDPRCYFYLTGTMFSNITCRLIMAQMSGTRADAFNWLLVPVGAAGAISLCVPYLPLEGELACLYLATAAVTAAHLHYAVCLLIQLCQMLNIQCFSISPTATVIPPESKPSGSTNINEDRQRLLSDQDHDDSVLEVVVGSNDNSVDAAAAAAGAASDRRTQQQAINT